MNKMKLGIGVKEDKLGKIEWMSMIKAETEKAILLFTMAKEEGKIYKAEKWLPKSQIAIDKNIIEIPDWLETKLMYSNPDDFFYIYNHALKIYEGD
jgi:hypothetical protein